MIGRRPLLGCFLLGSLASTVPTAFSLANTKGTFRGRIIAEWLPDNRSMRLQEPFEYVGPDGRRWPVPAGTVVDGASIPQVFWGIIGAPFTGPYRNASVIHDFYCERRTRRFRDVHRVFYDAMLASDVGSSRAWLMYKAVDQFGPAWNDPKVDPACEIVDENYDFEKCARNTTPPAVQHPPATRSDLLKFAEEMQGQADEADLAKLREAIGKT